jgi:hypothetical protein
MGDLAGQSDDAVQQQELVRWFAKETRIYTAVSAEVNHFTSITKVGPLAHPLNEPNAAHGVQHISQHTPLGAPP